MSRKREISIFVYVGLLIALFLSGLLGLLVLRRSFDRMTGLLDRITMNQWARNAIGHDIADGIHDLETGYFQLAPLTGLYEQEILIRGLQKIIVDIKQDLDVLKNGGSIHTEVALNTGLKDRTVRNYTYKADPTELYNLPAIELLPKLADVEQRMDQLGQLLEKRNRHRKSGGQAAFFKNIKKVKTYLMQSIPLFRRMQESANNLLYESTQRLEKTESLIRTRKRQYRQIETGLTLVIVCALLALSILIFGRIRTIIRKERKDAKELRRVSAFLKTVLESLTHPFCVLDSETYQVVMANSAARNHSAHPEATRCHKLIFGQDNPCIQQGQSCPLELIRETGKPLVQEQVRMLNGQKQIIELHGYPVLDPDGKVVQMVEYCVDITERKRAERDKKELEEKMSRLRKMEAMGVMAGGIAHDLNNILSGIIAYPEMLLSDLPADSELRKPLQTIENSGKRAAAVVADLLTIARGVSSRREVKSLNRLINTYLQSGEHALLQKKHPHVRLETSLDPALLNIACSPVHIQKVLTNLIQNAAEAITDEGAIHITTKNRYLDKPIQGWAGVGPGEYVQLVVSDTGIGIPPENIERIFEPFYTKRILGKTGTGLGLAVVWNTLLDHEGYIAVESSAEGTRFELLFPASRETMPETAQEFSVTNLKGNGQTVLVIDDDETLRNIAQRLLKTLGYSPSMVSSGEKAVAFLQQQPVDLLLLDMIMDPGIDGLETFRRIREIRPNQKAVIASGFSRSERVRRAQDLGAGGFLKKPYTLLELGLAIQKELANQPE